uniref:WGS project CBME000000000 data, contig CS3487_c000752 n=1 Tax=Fusarium pseudograminearum CS3487 TaxID=1318458 RepID=A0A096PCM4_FUSPS|nr:unnamed protein product [Fusarium pseudograminearum CS3487]
MQNRIGVVASDLSDVVDQLTKLSSEDIPRADRQIAPRIGFVFSGQGAQYPRMGQSLLRTWPTFTSSMKRAVECVKACGSSWDLPEELLKDASESRMEDPCIAQHMSTAVQICLVDTLKDLGVIPTAVVGHSSAPTTTPAGAPPTTEVKPAQATAPAASGISPPKANPFAAVARIPYLQYIR